MSAAPALALQTERLRLTEVVRRRDVAALDDEYAAFAATNPRRFLELARDARERAELRLWLEAWDACLHEWVLADDGPLEPLLALLTPDADGRFARRHWTLMAFWLAEAGSARLGEGALPEELRELDFLAQARALGRFCTRHDGRTAVDYARLHDALDARLRPFLAHWALVVHGLSPNASFDREVRENRRRTSADFARCHARGDLGLGADPLYFQVGYRVVYHSPDAVDFLSVLSDRLLAPRLAPEVERARRAELDQRRHQRRDARDRATDHAASGDDVGVLLSCFTEHHAVRRSTEPLLAAVRDAGAWRAYFPDGDRDAARATLGEAWAGNPAHLVAQDARRMGNALELAGRIAADRLDFLFFPEVGISSTSAILATQRLARVQATTYGHPCTSGSHAMDYFVSGADVEDGRVRYRERLVLLPGLGVSSNVPPTPAGERARPTDSGTCRFASLSSTDKLHGELLAAWRGVLEVAGDGSELHHFPGARGGAADAVECAVRGALGARADYRPHAAMPRADLLRELREADVLLDSFPFSGFNTLVDALSLSLPVVTLRRPGFAGSLGAAVMTSLGCADECVADTPADYVAKAARIARDVGLRRDLRARLSRERVLARLCDDSLGEHFRAAVAWMRAQGPGASGPPVYIEAGEAPRVLAR